MIQIDKQLVDKLNAVLEQASHIKMPRRDNNDKCGYKIPYKPHENLPFDLDEMKRSFYPEFNKMVEEYTNVMEFIEFMDKINLYLNTIENNKSQLNCHHSGGEFKGASCNAPSVWHRELPEAFKNKDVVDE